MKKLFPEYNKKTDKEYKKIWKDALIYLDTSFLLDLYRISEDSRKEFFELLDKLKDQLWLPYQVAKEYNRNRYGVILGQISSLDRTIAKVNNSKAELINSLIEYKEYALRTPIRDAIDKSFDGIIKEIEKIKAPYLELKKSDVIFDKLCKLFSGKISDEYEKEWLEGIAKDGEIRYKKGIPPGYMDKGKESEKQALYDEYRIYGDLIVWNDILGKAKASQKPAIFVTGDVKEDWMWKISGEKRGARPELIVEMRERAEQDLLLYATDRFYSYGREMIGKQVNETTVNEIQKAQEFTKQLEELRMKHDFLKTRYQLERERKKMKLTELLDINNRTRELKSRINRNSVLLRGLRDPKTKAMLERNISKWKDEIWELEEKRSFLATQHQNIGDRSLRDDGFDLEGGEESEDE